MAQLLAGAGYEPSAADWEYYEEIRARLEHANQTMNLTRLTEPMDFYRKHVLDSVLPFLNVTALAKLAPHGVLCADIGSGCGFPGLAVRRLFPHWEIALIEKTIKKAAFLEDTVGGMQLERTYVVPLEARAAPSAAKVMRRGCKVVLARAVGRIAVVTEMARQLVSKDGMVVHYKGGTIAEDEWSEGRKAASKAGQMLVRPKKYALPPDAERSVVLARKRTAADRKNHHTSKP